MKKKLLTMQKEIRFLKESPYFRINLHIIIYA